MIGAAGSPAAYRRTLERLAPWWSGRSRGARPRLAADPRRGAGAAGGRPAYLDALEAGRDELPPGRDTVPQREIHADNVAKHVG